MGDRDDAALRENALVPTRKVNFDETAEPDCSDERDV